MGKPAKPIRLMVSLLILKQVRNLSDESPVKQRSENLYYQYLGDEHQFHAGSPYFTEPIHDSKTLPEVLEQYERLTRKEALEVFVGRGYKSKSEYKSSKIYVPKPVKNSSKSKRQKT